MEAIDKLLNESYTVQGRQVKGQAISFLKSELRGVLKLPSNLCGFEVALCKLGYRVSYGTNSRGQSCTVVHN